MSPKTEIRSVFIFSGLFVLITCMVFPVVPGFNGARSLGLGGASTAFTFDLNMIFINPALLGSNQVPFAGIQYQRGFVDRKTMIDSLDRILSYDLDQYETLQADSQKAVFDELKSFYDSRPEIFGTVSKTPAYVGKNFAAAYSSVDAAVLHPQSSQVFSKAFQTVTNLDIASLNMTALGLHYKDFVLAYGQRFSQNLNLGISIHYLTGKLTDRSSALIQAPYLAGTSARTYLEDIYDLADESFSRITVDVAALVQFGKYFQFGLCITNLGNPKLTTDTTTVSLPKKTTFGAAFRPDSQWGVYLDADIFPVDSFFSGKKEHFVSLGLEKSFFQSRFYVRAGLQNDLKEKYFFGSKSGMLVGLGLGFNLGRLIVDGGMMLDHTGQIAKLAVTGYWILR